MTPSWTTHPWVAEGSGTVRFGIGLSYGGGDWVQQRDLVQAAEDLGFDSVWTTDHPTLFADSWTTLAAYAVSTHHIRLGSLVNCVYHRNPVMLVRQAVDVDQLSNGRVVLGLGAGWLENEFAFLRISFPPTGERIRHLGATAREVHRLLEAPPIPGLTLGAVLRMPSEEAKAAGFAGLPIQRPRIPLLIGGAGDKILRLVAAYSDVCSLEYLKVPTPEDIDHKFQVLDGYLDEHGRAADSIIRSHFLMVGALADTEGQLTEMVERLPEPVRHHPLIKSFTARDLIAYYRPIVAAGAHYLIIHIVGIDLVGLRVVAETVMPELQSVVAS